MAGWLCLSFSWRDKQHHLLQTLAAEISRLHLNLQITSHSSVGGTDPFLHPFSIFCQLAGPENVFLEFAAFEPTATPTLAERPQHFIHVGLQVKRHLLSQLNPEGSVADADLDGTCF